jgi:hypothetical protein
LRRGGRSSVSVSLPPTSDAEAPKVVRTPAGGGAVVGAVAAADDIALASMGAAAGPGANAAAPGTVVMRATYVWRRSAT